MRFDGDPRWYHDDECRWDNLCAVCLKEMEQRDVEQRDECDAPDC